LIIVKSVDLLPFFIDIRVSFCHILFLMDTQQKISERIKTLIKERGFSVKPFGEKLGIYNLGRMLNNERNWTLKNLEKIAGALGVTVGSLTQDYADIPIIVVVKSNEPFQFPLEIKKDQAKGWVPAPVPVEAGGASLVAKMYALEIKDNKIFDKPVTLIAQKDAGDEIETGDYVIYCCPKGIGHIGKVKLFDDKVFFKNLDPGDPFQDELLDRGQLRMMDRVAYIKM
jgi:transcriptional regulator with XRE-family HTH domain